MPNLGIESCPLCHKEVVVLGPCNGEWIFIAACKTMDCPYSVEYHGPGQIVPTAQYQKAKARGMK